MDVRQIALGAGTAVTTFLVAGAGTIELLGAGEAPGIGILGVFAGLVVGLLAGGIVAAYGNRVGGVASSLLVAYATFGVALVAIAALQYVNVPGADDAFTLPVHVGVSALAAVVVAVLERRRGISGDRPASGQVE